MVNEKQMKNKPGKANGKQNGKADKKDGCCQEQITDKKQMDADKNRSLIKR
ncbi:hypothetical protein [Sarcina sp. DSM 11001]|uniref:hypothetical protein n=1 Tax=Sarcina sp. DSM 11001 TaxID=1798184 RepID=UPI0015873E88|nr:hypothetical protein [Sarcina sp. DSM 11001]